jgi:hypothetical protein
MTCPTCGQLTDCTIVNISTKRDECRACCKTFLPHFVLTLEDILFLHACGIDSEAMALLDAAIKRRASSATPTSSS